MRCRFPCPICDARAPLHREVDPRPVRPFGAALPWLLAVLLIAEVALFAGVLR